METDQEVSSKEFVFVVTGENIRFSLKARGDKAAVKEKILEFYQSSLRQEEEIEAEGLVAFLKEEGFCANTVTIEVVHVG